MAKLGKKRSKQIDETAPAKSCFVLTLKAKTERWQEDRLARRFKACKQVSNSLTSMAQRRWNYLCRNKKFLAVRRDLTALHITIATGGKKTPEMKEQQALLFEQLRAFLAPLNLDCEWSFHREVTDMAHQFNLPFAIAQKIATRVYGGFVDLLDGKADKLRYSKHHEAFSVEGKTNTTNITLRFCENKPLKSKKPSRKGRFEKSEKLKAIYAAPDSTRPVKQLKPLAPRYQINAFDMSIPVKVRSTDLYAQEALQKHYDQIKYNRICYNPVYGYHTQMVMPGMPPQKDRKPCDTSKAGGLDIGTQTVAYHGNLITIITVLCAIVEKQEAEIRLLLRKMDRSKRKSNPDNYNDNGTIKPHTGKKGRMKWVFSKRYVELRTTVARLRAKQAALRTQCHFVLANAIADDAGTIYYENLNFAGLAKKGHSTDDKGNEVTKTRFGRTIAHRAPAKFVATLAWVLHRRGGELVAVNTRELKASQYDHQTDTCTPKSLSKRWNIMDGRAGPISIQRDGYSGFLMKHTNPDLSTYNKPGLHEDFDEFVRRHDLEIQKLIKMKKNNVRLPSSLGIKIEKTA